LASLRTVMMRSRNWGRGPGLRKVSRSPTSMSLKMRALGKKINRLRRFRRNEHRANLPSRVVVREVWTFEPVRCAATLN